MNNWSNGWDSNFWDNGWSGGGSQAGTAASQTGTAPPLSSGTAANAGTPSVTGPTTSDPLTTAIVPVVQTIPVAAATTDPSSSTVQVVTGDGSAAMVAAPVVAPAVVTAAAPAVSHKQFFLGVAVGFGLCWLFHKKHHGGGGVAV